MNLRDKVSDLFGIRMFNTGWREYLDQANSAGKVTARSTMELLIIVLEELEAKESNP